MWEQLKDGRTDLIMDILDAVQDPQQTDDQGISLLQWCAYYGDVTAIKFLVRQGADLAGLGDNYDLNGAVFHGHWQLCQFLLQEGADANYVLKDNGESMLHNAICKPNNPVSNIILELLLSYGADPNAVTHPNKPTGGFMRDARTKAESPLHRAAAFGNEETINLLLAAGADKTLKDMQGDSPLSWASWHSRPARILHLLSYDQHQVHPMHIKNMQSDHGSGWGGATSIMRLGKPHIKTNQ